ncbi:TRAP transporter small permease subunit [Rhizobium paknamense]|uniref:TRAP transporter small permease protein n=1 Tax=Rhizobium paknamense TaxID=1206817 RepID=A0ABU0IDC3_9HYPH|nr:TRAP transporter small permease subunit [Rhizobium paknamense]MDQ0456242.1 TRAP-type mannitol/chloroaromatic compound transport system permease small subunit [Rhizobium paknamense]
MTFLLSCSRAIDALGVFIGRIAEYLVMLCCLISAGNAIIRYLFNQSSNGWLEIQWYLFAYVVLMGAAMTLKNNGHVRVDLLYGGVSERMRLWIDLIGLLLFLLPVTAYLAWLCWPFFLLSYQQAEVSANAGGLIRWPVKLILVSGFCLMFLQGLSEVIKRLAAISGRISLDTAYEKPLQ